MEYGKSMAGYRQGPIYSKLWLKGTNDPTTLTHDALCLHGLSGVFGSA